MASLTDFGGFSGPGAAFGGFSGPGAVFGGLGGFGCFLAVRPVLALNWRFGGWLRRRTAREFLVRLSLDPWTSGLRVGL